MLIKNINKNILRAILSSSAPPLLVYTVAIMCLTLNILELLIYYDRINVLKLKQP